MRPFLNLAGDKYGRLKVISKTKAKNGRSAWNCICDCGKMTVANQNAMRNGTSISCGCFKKERQKESSIKHNLSNTKEYGIWKNMIIRCYNVKVKDYKNYGGRGITVCDEWKNSIEQFIIDMGIKPFESAQLDRIDNNLSYYKENCRWVSRSENQNNRRYCINIEINGAIKTLAEWSKILKLTRYKIKKLYCE